MTSSGGNQGRAGERPTLGGSFRAKSGRMGRPCTRTWPGWSPAFNARSPTFSVGQKHVVTSLWNLHKFQNMFNIIINSLVSSIYKSPQKAGTKIRGHKISWTLNVRDKHADDHLLGAVEMHGHQLVKPAKNFKGSVNGAAG